MDPLPGITRGPYVLLHIFQRSVTPDRTGIMLIAAIKHISSVVSKPNLVFPARCRHAFKSIKQVDIPRSILCIRSEEHTSELQSLMRNSYAVLCLKKQKY